MNYWAKNGKDMKMAADLKAMHKAKRLATQVPVYGETEDGKLTVVGQKTVYFEPRISPYDRHLIAMRPR